MLCRVGEEGTEYNSTVYSMGWQQSWDVPARSNVSILLCPHVFLSLIPVGIPLILPYVAVFLLRLKGFGLIRADFMNVQFR